MRFKRVSGFSLVELSIVLVILGLLVGGILGGQSLIRAAELRSIVTDRDQYVTAINAFRAKYNALPGDLPNATEYWGAANATNSTCVTTVRTAANTCNGNGDGVIGGWNSPAYDAEHHMMWEHLSLSGILPGSYKGWPSLSPGNSYTSTQVGYTSPASKIKGAGWVIASKAPYSQWGTDGTYGVLWRGKYNHQLTLAGHNQAALDMAMLPDAAALSSEDAYGVDSKVDDGKPGTGAVRTTLRNVSAGQCSSSVTATDASTATYALVDTGIYCRLLFDIGF